MLVDGRYWLEGYEASTSFFILPSNVKDPPTYSDTAFYADCIAFEHEFAALAVPAKKTLTKDELPWDLLARRKDIDSVQFYIDWLREGFEIANRINFGMERHVIFKYDWYHSDRDPEVPVHIPWTATFGNVRTAIHLYNAALRQVDPLSQYLCLYRVIENVASNNGKAWVTTALAGTLDYAVPIQCARERGTDLRKIIGAKVYSLMRKERLASDVRYFNILEVTRARAVRRLNDLRNNGTSDSNIADRLYAENRCGIAHGKKIRQHDFSEDFREVVRDLPLIRFLARLAIEEAIANRKKT